MPVVFGEVKMSLWVRKMASGFFERQQQLVNSGNNISFPSSANVSEQIHSSSRLKISL